MIEAFADETKRKQIRAVLQKQARNAYHGACAYLFHPQQKVPGRLALYYVLAALPFAFAALGFVHTAFFFGIGISFIVNQITFYFCSNTWSKEIISIWHIAQVLNIGIKLLPELPPSLADTKAKLEALTTEMKPSHAGTRCLPCNGYLTLILLRTMRVFFYSLI